MTVESVRVIGAGLSDFGKLPDKSVVELAADAALAALGTSGLQPGEIDAVYCGETGEIGLGQQLMVALGRGGMPIVNAENACATSATAFYLAQLAIRAGEARTCLVVGAHSYSAPPPAGGGPRAVAGLDLPGMYARIAQRHMTDHGTTVEDLALVSVKSHEHAAANPRAYFRQKLTVDEVLAARMISDPLTLWQCCARTDGAAALVLQADDGGGDGPRVRACVLRSGVVDDDADPGRWGVDLVAATASEAWTRAAVDPNDVDVFEVHDAFTIGELVAYEGLGLCAPGDSGKLLRSRVTWMGGASPVNPSGGLLARGHPVAATGAAMLAEITMQLTGTAGGHQVDGARLGVAETMGGGVSGISGNACCITVLEA